MKATAIILIIIGSITIFIPGGWSLAIWLPLVAAFTIKKEPVLGNVAAWISIFNVGFLSPAFWYMLVTPTTEGTVIGTGAGIFFFIVVLQLLPVFIANWKQLKAEQVMVHA